MRLLLFASGMASVSALHDRDREGCGDHDQDHRRDAFNRVSKRALRSGRGTVACSALAVRLPCARLAFACTVSALSDIGIPAGRAAPRHGPPAFLRRLTLCRPRHEPRRGDLVDLTTSRAEMLPVEPHGLAHGLLFLTRANMYRGRLHICCFLPALKYLLCAEIPSLNTFFESHGLAHSLMIFNIFQS